jgi:hypothetical protein
VTITFISMKDDVERVIKAMKLLKVYMINDSAIFNFINVTKHLLRKMALE